ncbi:hypothetical protein Tco_1188502 [Tanacetum coccineum]
MLPRRMNQTVIEQLIAERVATSLVKHEANRANVAGGPEATRPVGGVVGRNIAPEVRNCTYKNFMNCNPHTFSGTEGAVEMCRWFEKLESVFRISNCSEEHKFKFATCTLLVRALTWWNAIVQSLALLCPTMVEPEYKKIERYIWELSLKIQGNVTSSKPVTTHDAIRMAHELMDQVVRAKAGRNNDNNKRKTEGKKLPEFMLLAQLKEGVMLGTNRYAIDASCITLGHALLGAEVVKRGHYKNECLKKKGQQVEGARGRAYVMRNEEPQQDPNMVTVMRFLALGWHLEEIHVTWAHLEKKWTRLQLYPKNHEELFTQSLETASQP